MCQGLIEYLKDKSILILGFGREGRSTYNYIRKYLPKKVLTVADQANISIDDENVKVITGSGYMDSVNDYDIVIKSPGIAVCKVEFTADTEVTCQLDLFLRFSGCTVVGITGTKGKSTTSSLIYEMCKAAGIKTCLIGNIGVPVFDQMDDVEGLTAVIEMSSHQLEFTHKSPHVAVLTNVFEEHLDHYNGFEEYVNAKLNIVRYQGSDDFFICNKDQDIGEFIDKGTIKSNIKEVSSLPVGDLFNDLNNIKNPRINGKHIMQDVFFAATAVKCLHIDDDAIKAGMKNFKGIPHRMELIGTYKGIDFYDDCIATIPHAVMCAVESIENIGTIIIGGMDRGLDYNEFEKDLESSKLKNIICLPETGHKIGNNMLKNGSNKNIVIAENMEDAVEKAFELTAKGMACLLSPAASSYNVYKNFEEKGKHYAELVEKIGKA